MKGLSFVKGLAYRKGATIPARTPFTGK